jgi:hypothetical protein
MKRLLSSCLAVSAAALLGPTAANAAAFTINDTSETGIVFSANDFEGGISLDGTLLQSGLNNPGSRTVSEGTTLPITHTFSGDWITGALVPSIGTIAFQEGSTPTSQGVSDILTFAYTAGPLGGHLTGTFESDIEGALLPLPTGATVVSEATPFVFNNGNITASATSDVDVPEPASLAVFGCALIGFGVLRFRRKRG